MNSRLVIVVLALSALLIPAAGAEARTCAKSGKLVSGELVLLTNGHEVQRGATLRRGNPYEVHKAAVVRFQRVVYELTPGSEFMLACFGHTPKEGAIYPRVHLNKGQATSEAKQGAPGAIDTNEAMADPFADRAMTIHVRRVPRGGGSMLGTTTIDRRSSDGFVNVTPYVGRKPGTCRQSRAARRVSKSFSGGYFRGTAKYYGYSPNSPR